MIRSCSAPNKLLPPWEMSTGRKSGSCHLARVRAYCSVKSLRNRCKLSTALRLGSDTHLPWPKSWTTFLLGDSAHMGPTLIDGSLFLIRQLEVHPAFRGQRIGARLLLHALLKLGRGTGDVAVGLVKPIRSMFEIGEPATAAERCATTDVVLQTARFLAVEAAHAFGRWRVWHHVRAVR